MRKLAPLVLVPVLLLGAACTSDGSSDASPTASASASATAAASASSSPSVAETPGPLPTASGAFGTKPTITIPSGEPGTALQSKVLVQGTGKTVTKGDLLVANYLGEIWGSKKVFDNSYDRGEPASFGIGTGQVITGWDDALVGKKVGSRVLLVIPPKYGYGSSGQTDAGISGTDTLVFVVDIVGTYGKGAVASGQVVSSGPQGGPQVANAKNPPTVTIPASAAVPTEDASTVLIRGTGAKVNSTGALVIQYAAYDWTGALSESTWETGTPYPLPAAGLTTAGSPFASLVGLPVGSRVLLEVPAPASTASPSPSPSPTASADPKAQSFAVVVDVIAQLPSAPAATATPTP